MIDGEDLGEKVKRGVREVQVTGDKGRAVARMVERASGEGRCIEVVKERAAKGDIVEVLQS